MIAPTLTALAVVFLLGQQVPVALQAMTPVETETVEVEQPIRMPVEVPEIVLDQPAETIAADPAGVPDTARPAITEPTTEIVLIPVAAPATPVEEAEPAPVPTELSAAQQAQTLTDVKTALANAKTAKGSFSQTNADGSIMTGDFALRRPGKMRFDYHAPTPILIVSDGTTVAMEDSELETVDRIPLGSTPLGLILDDDLDFSDDVDVLRVNKNNDKVWITVTDATGEVEGELTMILSALTYDLLGWMTVDADLQMTSVELSDVETNGRVNPRLFRLDEAEDEEDER